MEYSVVLALPPRCPSTVLTAETRDVLFIDNTIHVLKLSGNFGFENYPKSETIVGQMGLDELLFMAS